MPDIDLSATDFAAALADIQALPETPPAPALPPLLSGGQRQGDVFVQPDEIVVDRRMRRAATALGDGQEIVIVPDGNQHVLRACTAPGGWVWVWKADRSMASNIVLLLVVEAPAYCLLVQPGGPNPHAPLGIAPGAYSICRQAEPQVVAPPVMAYRPDPSYPIRYVAD